MNLTKSHSIVPNGSTTSASLNTALEEISDNFVQINEDLYETKENFQRFMKRSLLQQTAMSNYISATTYTVNLDTLSTILISAYDLIDASPYIIIDGSSVRHWREYGLVTPPLSSVPVNQFTVADANGLRWVPKSTILQYSVGPQVAEPDTSGLGWTTELDSDKLSAAFDEQCSTAWFADLSESGDVDIDIWIKAKLPAEYLYQTTANAIVVHPEPMLGAKLMGAWYSYTSNPNVEIPMPWDDYIPETGRDCVNEMFLVPSSRISDVKFHFVLPQGLGSADIRAFYLTHIGVYNIQFEQTGEVTIGLNDVISQDITLAEGGHIVNYRADQTDQPVPVADTGTNSMVITLSNNGYGNVPDTIRDITCNVSEVIPS